MKLQDVLKRDDLEQELPKLKRILSAAKAALASKKVSSMLKVIDLVEKTDYFGGESYNGWFISWDGRFDFKDDLSSDEHDLVCGNPNENEFHSLFKQLPKLSKKTQELVQGLLEEDMQYIINKIERPEE